MMRLLLALGAGCATNEALAPAPLELEVVEEDRAFGGLPAAPPADGTELSSISSGKMKLRDVDQEASVQGMLGALGYAQADAPEPEPDSEPT
ncbi:MAG: hypothetical protein AAF211_29385, partial [Myxococcota bacterium]